MNYAIEESLSEGVNGLVNGSLHKTRHTQVTADARTSSTGARTWQEADGVIFPGSHCPVEFSACQVQNEMSLLSQSIVYAADWGGGCSSPGHFRRKQRTPRPRYFSAAGGHPLFSSM